MALWDVSEPIRSYQHQEYSCTRRHNNNNNFGFICCREYGRIAVINSKWENYCPTYETIGINSNGFNNVVCLSVISRRPGQPVGMCSVKDSPGTSTTSTGNYAIGRSNNTEDEN